MSRRGERVERIGGRRGNESNKSKERRAEERGMVGRGEGKKKRRVSCERRG